MTYLFYREQCADGKLRLSRSCFYHRSYSRSGYLGCLRLQQSPFLLGPDTNSSKLLKLLLLFLLFMRGRQFQYLSCKTNIMVLQTRFANLSYLFLLYQRTTNIQSYTGLAAQCQSKLFSYGVGFCPTLGFHQQHVTTVES